MSHLLEPVPRPAAPAPRGRQLPEHLRYFTPSKDDLLWGECVAEVRANFAEARHSGGKGLDPTKAGWQGWINSEARVLWWARGGRPSEEEERALFDY